MTQRNMLYIKELTLEALIGIYPEERKRKTTLCLNIELETSFTQAIVSDHIDDALSYETIYNDVCAIVETSSFQLLESLAQALVEHCMSYATVQHVRVDIGKPNIFPKAHSAGVVMECGR